MIKVFWETDAKPPKTKPVFGNVPYLSLTAAISIVLQMFTKQNVVF